MKKVTPVIRWAGGKRRLLKQLLPLIPAHKLYCEPFAGGLALLLAKPASEVEVVNDLNGDLVSLYRCAQFHLDALIAEIEFTVQARRNVLDMISQKGLTDLQRAARFLLVNRGSFGGAGASFAVQRSQGPPSRANVVDALRALNRRLDRVSIENLPYERILKLYDGPESFFFLDPPYLHATAEHYRGWEEEEMSAFAERVKKLSGQWLVTVDDSPFNRALFDGCAIQAVTTRNGSVNQRTNSAATFGELIIQPAAHRAAGALRV